MKDFVDYYAMAHKSPDELMRYDENADLHAGRWTTLEQYHNSLNISIGSEAFDMDFGKLRHYPLLDQVTKETVSKMISRPLIPVIKDSSSKARNYRERVMLDRVKTYFQNTVINPELERITMEYDIEFGIQDVPSLTIEQQRQREADIQRRFREQTPEETLDYMQRLTTPNELIGEAIIKEGIRYTKAKMEFDIGAEYAVMHAEEYYRMGIINQMPYLKALNPKWVVWGGSEHVQNSADGIFATYRQYLAPEDALFTYSQGLMKSDITDIAKMYSKIPDQGYQESKQRSKNGIDRVLIDLFADNPELQDEIQVNAI